MMRTGLDDQVLKRDLAGARVTHGSGLKLHSIKALFFRESVPRERPEKHRYLDLFSQEAECIYDCRLAQTCMHTG